MVVRILSRKISNKSWLKRHVDDYYVKEAAAAGLRSRSAFKLLEIQEKHKVFTKHDVVLDLGVLSFMIQSSCISMIYVAVRCHCHCRL
jgi:23S rRNA (uridine2552-2'-O)-methyltransferase